MSRYPDGEVKLSDVVELDLPVDDARLWMDSAPNVGSHPRFRERGSARSEEEECSGDGEWCLLGILGSSERDIRRVVEGKGKG